MVTSSDTSATLKSALNDRNFGDYTTIGDLRTWWYADHCFTYMGTMFGLVKTVSDTAKPRLFEQSDTTIVRAWAIPEILNFLLSNVQYVNYEFSTVNGGLTRRCVITVTDGENERQFQADADILDAPQEQADTEAFALALVELLEDEDFETLLN